MNVSVRRTGGIAGIVLKWEVDSADAELRRLVEAAFAEPQSLKPAIPDSLSYSVTVTDDEGTERHRSWNEHELGPTSRALVDRVRGA